MSFDLVCIGNPVYDLIVTPWAKSENRVLSGCSTNACLAAKRLGMKRVGLVGRIGKDRAARFRHDMINYGVEVSIDDSANETGGFRLVYDEKGNRTLDLLGVAGKISQEKFPEEFLQSNFFLVGPILGEIDLDFIEFLRSSASSPIFLDPQGLVRLVGQGSRILHTCDRTLFSKIVKLVDFVKPNEHESETITGERDPIRALRSLKELGAVVSIVTVAERGSVLSERDRLYRIPAFATKAIDPTGAGDVYAGSFVTEYRRTRKPVDAALFASAAASLMVEQMGPDFRMSQDSVRKRMESIRERLLVEELR